MRAARIDAYGEPPHPVEDAEPPAPRGAGQALLEVRAAPINPVDIAISSGRFYGGSPPLPYVPGREGIGVVIEGEALPAGSRVRFLSQFGQACGSFAERVVADEATMMEVTDGVSDAVAASLGVSGLAAWLGLDWRARLRPGEHVLVLGASGAVGQLAVQAARLLGAARVVAGARNAGALARCLELGADATVDIGEPELSVLADSMREACGGRLDVVLDPVWGIPAAAACLAASPRARLVNLGQAASDEATLISSVVRGRALSVLGLTIFAVPGADIVAAYQVMLGHAAAGRLVVDHEVIPLTQVTEAWDRQRSSPHVKLILDPRR